MFRHAPFHPSVRRRFPLSRAPGTLVLSGIVGNNAVGWSGQSGTFSVFDDTGATLLASKNATVDGGNGVALTDALFATGIWYRVYIVLSNGAQGSARVQAS